MSELQYVTLPVGTIQQNCRIFFNPTTKKCFVVDPGAQAAMLQQFINQEGLIVEAIVLTHGHFDHIGAVAPLRELLGYAVPVYGPFAEDEVFFNQVVTRSREFGLPDQVFDFTPDVQQGDRFFQEDETLVLLDLPWRVLHTPGHSPGSASLIQEQVKVALVGDVLFNGGIGRTDLYGGSFTILEKSIKEKLYSLPGDYLVLSGHGPETTLDHERATNPYVQAD